VQRLVEAAEDCALQWKTLVMTTALVERQPKDNSAAIGGGRRG